MHDDYWKRYWERAVSDSETADPFRQVGRTLAGEPMGPARFARHVEHVRTLLRARPEHVVLDLCCGNGLFAVALAPHVRQIDAVDFTAPLLATLERRAPRNVRVIAADVRELERPPESCDRILVAAALQHFSNAELVALLRRAAGWLRPGGVLLATDVLDAARRWRFFDTPERVRRYFQGVAAGAPVLGNWCDREWLERAARDGGFAEVQTMDQPADYWYAHYRFDLRCAR